MLAWLHMCNGGGEPRLSKALSPTAHGSQLTQGTGIQVANLGSRRADGHLEDAMGQA